MKDFIDQKVIPFISQKVIPFIIAILIFGLTDVSRADSYKSSYENCTKVVVSHIDMHNVL